VELSDYAQALGAAQRLVPNYRDMQQQDAQTRVLQMQPQLIQAQIARSQAQSQQDEQKSQFEQQRRGAFQTKLQMLGARPSAKGLYDISAEFPEFATALQGAAKGISTEDSTKIVRNLAPVQSLIQNGKYDLAAAEVKRHIDADKAAGIEPDEHDTELYGMLTSGDPEQAKSAGGIVYGLLAALNPDTAAANLNKRDENAGGQYTLAPGSKRFDANGKLLASADFAPDRFTLSPGETRYDNNTGGGGPASSGGAAGAGGDVSRLINTDAGGGYVPEGVKTLGQFVGFGKDLNRRGAKSSSAGIYQINGSTMAEFAPKALGAGWKEAPFNAETQDRVGAAIFDWAKQQPDPAKALRGRWVSLDPGTASRLVQGSWQQARGVIAQGETGGAPGASAAAPAAGGARVVAQAAPKPGYRMLSPAETSAQGLDPNVKYQQSPDGQITALGGQSKAQLKPIPAAAASALVTNNSSIANIDSAIKLLDPKNKSNEAQQARYAIGTTNRFLPDAVLQNTNPEGVSFRAQIGQLGGLIVKDVSGAAVSASEDDRLAKWVPMVTDTPSAALAKLKNLRRELANKNLTISQTYGEDQGYRQPASLSGGGNIATVRSIQQANALPPGTLYRAPDGKVRRR
jgi:hypothetical protein